MTKETVIKVENVHKIYDSGGQIQIHALNEINIEICKGDFVAIMGASGSGKSTLMNIFGCLDKPTSGKYFINGIDTSNQNKNALAQIRRNYIGFVFQSYNLLARTTAFDNVELPLLYARKHKAAQRKELVINALQAVNLADRTESKPNQLSGGQQQRVAIARAIVNNPAVILADEPTGNLDTRTSLEIMDIFQKLNAAGTTIVVVTHENDIAEFCKSKIVFRDGKIISSTVNENQKIAANQLLKE